MLINLRNALMAGRRLPYDAEVEYLESTGTQWIDTGVVANGEFDADYTISTPSSFRTFTVGGARSATQQLNFGQYEPNGKFIMAYLGEYWVALTTIAANTTYTARIHYASGSQTATVNGTAASPRSLSGTESINLNIYLFKRNFYGASDTILPMTGKMYSFKIWQNGVLVRDYIPVRKGTVGYLYDRVSGNLFSNAGTGDFVLGPDVVPVEYLQSDGGQYIQTDFTPDDSYGFEVDCFTPVASSSYNSRAIGLQNGQVRWLYCTERRALSSSFFGWNEAVSVGSQLDKRIVARCNWLNNRTISIGDTVYKSNLATLDSVGGLKAVLFGINNGGSVLTSQLFVGKMYSAKVSVGNAIGYNYAPIRVGTEGAMMDVLTRRIYRNAGTGAFGYGNDLKYPILA